MIFIWSGLGFLVVPIVFVTSMAVAMTLESLLGRIGHPELQSVAIAIGLFAGAGANWLIGRKLNSKPPRELIDPKTNETVLLYRRHKLFWIPMQYWSFPVIAIGLSVLYAQASHAGSHLAPAHDAVDRFHQQARALA
jgi:hypothetical protein